MTISSTTKGEPTMGLNSEAAVWTTAPSLPAAVDSAQAITTENRVYLLGGHNGSSATSAVLTAPINPDGTLGTWTTAASLPIAVDSAQAITTENRVYLLGGYNGSSATSAVLTAPINPDGTLGTWTTASSLPRSVRSSQAIVTQNRVFLLGGYNSSSATSAVLTAPINPDGTLGTWTTAPPLPTTLFHSQAIVTQNRVFLLGGYNSSGTPTSTVYTAPINPDGTLGDWTTAPPLPNTLAYSQAIVTQSRVYLLGGYANGTPTSAVLIAPINPDGTLGDWTTGTSLPNILAYSQAIVTKSRLYLLGGYTGGPTSAVLTAPINPDGTLGDWTTSPFSLPAAVRSSQAITTENRVYLLGGYANGSYSPTVQTAEIDNQGQLVCKLNQPQGETTMNDNVNPSHPRSPTSTQKDTTMTNDKNPMNTTAQTQAGAFPRSTLTEPTPPGFDVYVEFQKVQAAIIQMGDRLLAQRPQMLGVGSPQGMPQPMAPMPPMVYTQYPGAPMGMTGMPPQGHPFAVPQMPTTANPVQSPSGMFGLPMIQIPARYQEGLRGQRLDNPIMVTGQHTTSFDGYPQTYGDRHMLLGCAEDTPVYGSVIYVPGLGLALFKGESIPEICRVVTKVDQFVGTKQPVYTSYTDTDTGFTGKERVQGYQCVVSGDVVVLILPFMTAECHPTSWEMLLKSIQRTITPGSIPLTMDQVQSFMWGDLPEVAAAIESQSKSSVRTQTGDVADYFSDQLVRAKRAQSAADKKTS